MSVDYDALKSAHLAIARCCDCRKQFPSAQFKVICPPGNLYPYLPRTDVEVLFVSVAPPRPGKHFYSSANDGLRNGLYAVLLGCGYKCSSVEQFHDYGFYLSHCAKCPIADTPYPEEIVCVFCSSQHLIAEITAIRPKAICFLSKTNGLSSCIKIAEMFGHIEPIEPRKIFEITVKDLSTEVLVTGWPGRRGLSSCRHDVKSLLTRKGKFPFRTSDPVE